MWLFDYQWKYIQKYDNILVTLEIKMPVSINIDESDFSTFENAGFNIKNNDILEIMKAI